jgi:hypothetical protein
MSGKATPFPRGKGILWTSPVTSDSLLCFQVIPLSYTSHPFFASFFALTSFFVNFLDNALYIALSRKLLENGIRRMIINQGNNFSYNS